MDVTDGTLAVESDWLPSVELLRLLGEYRAEFPQLVVAADSPEHRGLDPAIGAALVSGAFTLFAPFVTRLVDRIFGAEPKASVTVGDAAVGHEVVLVSSLSEELRNQLVAEAIESGALRVRISLEQPMR